jgi:hypothetical protein
LIHSPATSSEDTISSNDCGGKGGGICSNHSPLSVTNAVIRENTSSSIGGGIFHSSNNLIVKNAIVALNDAVILGGGIYADSSWGEIIFNTIDRNGSGYAGGNVFLGQSISFDVRNNLVTYGLQNGFETNVPGNIDFQFNNCFGNFPLNVSTVIPDSTNSSRNPHYADTTSLDYHLLVHSGGIDTGDPSGITDPDGSRPDQGAYGGPDAIMAAPEYVKNLSAVAVNDTAVQLEWESVLPGYLSFFAIYCDQADGFLPDESNFIGMAAPGENTFLHQPVAGCMYYRVSAVNILGYGGGYSNQGTACASGPDLVAPEVTVIYPNGGETCSDGDTIYIEWTASDNRSVDSLSIFYSVNGGTDFMLLASGEPNDSLYMWIVPLTPSDSCIVKVVAYDPGLRIGQDESDGFFTIHHLTRADDTPAFVNALEQNYPNPFNGTTTIAYSVAERCRVELCVYDAAGHLVRVLEHRIREPGHYSTVWRGRDDKGRSVSSAVYFCRIKAGSFRQTKKIIYLR